MGELNRRAPRTGSARRRCATKRRSDRPLLQLAPLPLAQPAPDAEPLVIGQRVLQALTSHVASQADLLRLPGGSALLREERLGIGLRAQRSLLPAERTPVVEIDQLVHGLCLLDPP